MARQVQGTQPNAHRADTLRASNWAGLDEGGHTQAQEPIPDARKQHGEG